MSAQLLNSRSILLLETVFSFKYETLLLEVIMGTWCFLKLLAIIYCWIMESIQWVIINILKSKTKYN